MTGATYRRSAVQTMTVRRSGEDSDGEVLEVESTWAEGGDLPPAHFHPAQDEHLEVLEGTLRVSLDGTVREVGPGEVLEIPRGTVHAMAATTGDARAIWQTRPALATESFFAGIDGVQRRGGSLLDLAPVVRAHAAEVRFTPPPRIVQAPLFAALGLVARVRGR